MKAYKGAPKRWIEGFYGGSYPPGEEAVEVRNPFFRRFFGRDALMVPNVGFRLVNGQPQARPLIVATDLQPGTFDAAGNPMAGGSNGFYELDAAKEPSLTPLRLLLERARQDQLVTLLPGDQHENPAYFDRNALTTTILDPDLGLLSPRERAIVSARYATWIGKRLPLGIWEAIFMDPADAVTRGQLVGKEERNFLPHCTEFVVRYLPEVEQWLDAQRQDVAQQVAGGKLVPRGTVFPIAKDGLTVDLPDDERGLGGNKFDAVLNAAFMGPYFQGDDHRGAKRAVVVGSLAEYSVRLAIEHLIDADVTVVWLLTATKSLDLFSAKLAEVHYLKERYGKKLVATYDWPEALLGPVPAGWAAAQAIVEAHDQAVLANWLPQYQAQLAAGLSGRGAPLVTRADALAAV
ncbi:MAG: hypothetical protein JWM80_2440 [Cyanobacteria bacterium RYN_339]|nr:hypothetical protein [Cyanobacteria bacterium RYN_339]